MLRQLRPAIASFVCLSIITGVIYPAIVTGIAKVAFADKASGSLIVHEGTAIGSDLIAQPFTGPKYFWPRPSAANYDAAAASGSNLGPSNPALADAVAARVKAVREADPGATEPVPAELVTASGSGLDPHISVAAANYQAARIARARGLAETDIRQLIEQNTEDRTLGLLGEPRVNVLRLNLLLDHVIKAAAPHGEHVVGWRGRGFLPESK